MTLERITKPSDPGIAPNLADYDTARRMFRWDEVRAGLDGLPGGTLNIAHEAVDRHVAHGRGDRLALRWIAKDGTVRDYSYGALRDETNRFARLLANLGVTKGERVFSLLGRVPELYFTALGALKAGAVYSPLFSAFGPEPVRARMTIGEASVLVTTADFYKKKVLPWRGALPSLRHVLVTDCHGSPPEGTEDLAALLAQTPAEFDTVPTDPEDMALLHFTSGTTGKPKGAIHVHQAIIAHYATGKLVLDFHDSDIYWCTADPGWVTGTSYGIISPLVNGVAMVVDQAEFDAERWYRILQDQKVTVWYTAPTAIRTLMKIGEELPRRYDLSALRFMASVGEPLNPEAVVWSQTVFGMPFHDNWWQTETGGIMIANYAAMDVKPGSMGRPLPGIEAAIVEKTETGMRVASQPMVVGELALKSGWPSMFRGYLNNEERYKKSFAGGWYLSGDLAMQDEDGYFWFVGRADDVIKSAGHLIGPFEVESALIEHAAVAEAAVIGIPDERMGEVVKAFVTLNPSYEWSDALQRELIGHARKRLGAAVAPRAIEMRESLPKTRSGKIMRRLLKARELGLPEGDISTLESDDKPAASTKAAPRETDKVSLTRDHALRLLHDMVRIRLFEEKCAELYTQEKIRGFLHLYIGEEAVAVGIMQALDTEDAVVATYREHGHALVRGVPMTTIMAEMYGKQEGCSRGRGGSMHLFDASRRFYGGNAIVGGGLPLAVGLALADKMQGLNRVTAVFFGEGAVAEGEFHESMNLAALWKLPVLFVCENNLYAMGTALALSESEPEIYRKAEGYRIPAQLVDGMNVVDVEAAGRKAVAHIRAGNGPYLLECRTYRFRAHSMFDAQLYRSKDEVEEHKAHGPIRIFTAWLKEAGYLHEDDLSRMEAEIAEEVEEAVAFAEAGTWEPVEDLTRDVGGEARP